MAVAQHSLHHLHDLREAVATIASLAPQLVVDELGWDLLDDATGGWYEGQRRMLVAAGRQPRGPALAEWQSYHAGLPAFETIRSALATRFTGRWFEPRPYLYRYLGGETTLALEQTLIDAKAIRPLGFRWAGARR